MRIALALALLSTTAYADSKAWSTAKGLVPSNAQVVGGINGANLRSSKLYDTVMPLAMSQAGDAKDQLDQIKKECGIDMLAAIDSVAFAVDDSSKGVIVLALKGTDRKSLEACAQKRAKADGKSLTIATAGKLTQYTGFTDKSLFVQWFGGDVVAMTTSPDDKDVSAAALAGKHGAGADFKTPLANVNTGAGVWGVFHKPQDLDASADTKIHVQTMYGSANMAKGNIDTNVHVITQNAKEATDGVAAINKQLDEAKKAPSPPGWVGILKSLVLKPTGSEIVGTVSVAQDDVFTLLGMLMRGK